MTDDIVTGKQVKARFFFTTTNVTISTSRYATTNIFMNVIPYNNKWTKHCIKHPAYVFYCDMVDFGAIDNYWSGRHVERNRGRVGFARYADEVVRMDDHF